MGKTTRDSFKNIAITQAIASIVFVLAPIAITLIAPLSTIEFERSGAAASVVVHRYVLMFLPWRTQRVENVTRIRADVTADMRYPDTAENRRKGRKGTRYGTGQVAIIGEGPEVIVQASPELAKDISAQFDRFRAEGVHEAMTFQVYASWWLSYALGGVMTFLCAFYLLGVTLAIGRFFLETLRPRASA